MGGFSLVVSLTIFKVGYGICLSDGEEGSGWGRGGAGGGGGGGLGATLKKIGGKYVFLGNL